MLLHQPRSNELYLETDTSYFTLKVPSNTIYQHCILVNALHMFTYPPNHEVLTDKLPGLLFGPLRGGAGEWPRTV